jgi:hypothetical protein
MLTKSETWAGIEPIATTPSRSNDYDMIYFNSNVTLTSMFVTPHSLLQIRNMKQLAAGDGFSNVAMTQSGNDTHTITNTFDINVQLIKN